MWEEQYMKKKNVIVDLSLEFASEIIDFCQLLENGKKYVIANQLLKSGTSIGANIREAQNSESLADFIHKFKMAAKEVEETEYWLILCQRSDNMPYCDQLSELLSDMKHIINTIIGTSKRRANNSVIR
jgi:four helix bundle protein